MARRQVLCRRGTFVGRVSPVGLVAPVVGVDILYVHWQRRTPRPLMAARSSAFRRKGGPVPTSSAAFERSVMPVTHRPDPRLARTDDSWPTLPNPANVR